MSRKVTQVTSHSPSQSSTGVALVLGLAVQADLGLRQPPQSCASSASATASMP